jgi:XTP/dITP diphosphohydrolase
MKKVLFATENESKVKRFKNGLLEKNIEIISLNNIDKKVEVIENGKNAIENALIKAKAYAKVSDLPVFAMDDNLYIDGIPDEKQPGMYVRRVNGKRLNDDEMIEYYSNLAHTYGKNGRLTCRWVYGIAVINKYKESTYTWSKEDFYIVDKPTNKINPGYPLNTISINKRLNKYFTDITEEDKKEIQENENDVIEFLCEKISK